MILTESACVILRRLLRSLSASILAIYRDFLAETANTESDNHDVRLISEKGALQLLFDVRFLRRVFEGAWKEPSKEIGVEERTRESKDVGGDLKKLADELIGVIKAKIDPIDLAVFEPHLEVNVERHYVRNSILLGLLLQLNPRPAETRRKALAIQEFFNTLPMAPQAPRFTLLPIGHKSGGRSCGRSAFAGCTRNKYLVRAWLTSQLRHRKTSYRKTSPQSWGTAPSFHTPPCYAASPRASTSAPRISPSSTVCVPSTSLACSRREDRAPEPPPEGPRGRRRRRRRRHRRRRRRRRCRRRATSRGSGRTSRRWRRGGTDAGRRGTGPRGRRPSNPICGGALACSRCLMAIGLRG
ncbi:LOW QUALITY PROTEIN: hypothetical protein BC936DRAFT_139478 [Jimgerdemannia flammicorona]|uniref:Conserved oligomeric Golgi complex subunit 1 n=1 Tax=Jimgerdemannia flammicorona TaxID=994334 RepID=A0A433DMQ3_9FUNG|nr:LOW QUALITY PROTEIN: hypothetical protein BC936DRAFT_139478 [Jimgerdemannia flammicorona]